MAATDPPGAGGSFLTRKLGPLPMWVWIGIGVAALYLYRSRQQAQQSASSTDAATSALANQGAAALQYGYSSPDLASMISNLQGQVALLGSGNNGTTATPATSPGSTGQPAMTQVGSGWFVPGSEVPLTGQGGHKFVWISGPSVLKGLPAKTPIFFQPVPGYFVQATGKETPGTPAFLEIS